MKRRNHIYEPARHPLCPEVFLPLSLQNLRYDCLRYAVQIKHQRLPLPLLPSSSLPPFESKDFKDANGPGRLREGMVEVAVAQVVVVEMVYVGS